MVFTPIVSGGKWKLVPKPEGITSSLSSSGYNDVTYTFNGLTKEHIKKGCFLCVHDYNSVCILYVHEDGKIEMFTGYDAGAPQAYSLVGSTTLSNSTTGVFLRNYNAPVATVIIGLE